MGAIRALTQADLRNINRDPLLKFFILYPWLLGLLMRWLVPFATEGLAPIFDIRPHYVLLASVFGLLIVPALMGVAVGFLLLDERDSGILSALQVTPFSTSQYLIYRLSVPFLLSLLSIFVVLPLMNLVMIPAWHLALLGLMAALEGPLFALALGTFAANKVQGFALVKGMGVFFIIPFGAWWVPEPWQWLAGLVPTYWPLKAFWVVAAGGNPWLFWVAGMLVHFLYLFIVLTRFYKRAYRV
jgi:fluoroquinolone transport system permease protein